MLVVLKGRGKEFSTSAINSFSFGEKTLMRRPLSSVNGVVATGRAPLTKEFVVLVQILCRNRVGGYSKHQVWINSNDPCSEIMLVYRHDALNS
jgi:hypothetical protein